MTRRRLRLGALGERLAAAHLESKGYRILHRNWRCREGEVDLVAERDGCLVFVEVRTRRGEAHGSPEESVTAAKAARLLAVAEAFDALSSARPHRAGLEIDEAVRIIESEAGKQFDPRFTKLLADVVQQQRQRWLTRIERARAELQRGDAVSSAGNGSGQRP